jgi:quinol monooxygenase YgiN
VVIAQVYVIAEVRLWPDPDTHIADRAARPDPARPGHQRPAILPGVRRARGARTRARRLTMLVKVFPIKLQDGTQDKVEAIVREFAPLGPATEEGTLSFRVYRDPAKPDYLLFVEHFADQAAYDAHTGSAAYRDLIAGQFASLIVDFVEIDHELVVAC